MQVKIRDKMELLQITCEKVKHIYDPLSRAFGIQAFGYRKFFPDGTSFNTSSNFELIKSVQEKFDNTIIPNYDVEIDSTLKNEKHFVLRIGEPDRQDAHLSALFDWDVWNTLSVYKKNAESIDAFYFTSTRENYKNIEAYINNIELFERFTLHFKEKLADILSANEIKKISSPTVSPFIIKDNDNGALKEEYIKDFISNTPIHSLSLNVDGKEVPLSMQEFKCLAWLSRGKTAKEVGRIMNLSPRTVESYMDNVKFKTRIDSRSKLIDLFILNFYKGSDLLKCIENKRKSS